MDTDPKPEQFTASGEEFLALCRRAKAGEFLIDSIERDKGSNSRWIVCVSYPQRKHFGQAQLL